MINKLDELRKRIASKTLEIEADKAKFQADDLAHYERCKPISLEINKYIVLSEKCVHCKKICIMQSRLNDDFLENFGSRFTSDAASATANYADLIASNKHEFDSARILQAAEHRLAILLPELAALGNKIKTMAGTDEYFLGLLPESLKPS